MVKIVSTVTERMINPFQIMEQCGANDTEDMPLLNIAIRSVAPQEIADDVQKAKEIGKNQFEKFVEKRINSNKEDFYKAVTRNDLKTFASLEKKTQSNVKVQAKTLECECRQTTFWKIMLLLTESAVHTRKYLL